MSRGTVAETLAGRLFREAFEGPRDPRSAEYKHGVLTWLRKKTGEIGSVREADCYGPGTASSDAFYAGLAEGRNVWDRHEEAQKKAGNPS